MALTDAQMEKALAYVARKMQEEEVSVQDIGGIVRWMIDNPLPSKAEYQAQVAVWEEEDKAKTIAHLQAQLAKLQGSN
jgi:hypothetical protein